MSAIGYRLCILDIQGRILFSRAVECADDLEALAEAELDCAGHPVEVWQNSRLVARVKADNAPLNEMDPTCL